MARIFSLSAVSAALVFCALSGNAAARPVLDGGRLEQLGRYDVLVFSDPTSMGVDRGKAIGVIDATPEEVFRVATDFGKYHEFVPRLFDTRVTSRSDSEAFVEMSARLPWPAGNNWIVAHYQFDKIPGDIFRVRFDMVRGSMRHYLGSIYIEPWSRGKSALTYELVAQPAGFAPKSAVSAGVKKSVGKFVHALRQRVNDLHTLGLLHPQQAPQPVRSPLVGKTRTTDPRLHAGRRN